MIHGKNIVVVMPAYNAEKTLRQTGSRSRNTGTGPRRGPSRSISTGGNAVSQVPTDAPTENRNAILRFGLPACLAMAAILYARIRLLGTPFERDEGEFAYVAQLILRGLSPFSHAYTMKLPGTGMMYALFMSILGQTAETVRIALLFANTASALLLHRLTLRMYGQRAAISAAAVFVVLSSSQSVLGLFAHATQFVLPFVLGGFLLIDRHIERHHPFECFLGGVCLGLAILMKQHAAVMAPYAAAWLMFVKTSPVPSAAQRVKSIALVASGAAIPYGAVCLWMAATGTFETFWFWTVRYAAQYSSIPSLGDGLEIFKFSARRMLQVQYPLWLLPLGGVATAFSFAKGTRRSSLASPLPFLAVSFLAVCPGFFFREHYFVLMIPSVAILAGLGIARLDSRLSTKLPMIAPAALAIALGWGIFLESDCLFKLSPAQVSRKVYGTNPFPESLEIARYIRDNSAPDDRIAVFGSEPEILFYSDRLSATGIIYTYGLMEEQPFALMMQEQMAREIEESRPLIFVNVFVPTSWLPQKGSNMAIFGWSKRYLGDNFEPVAFIDMTSGPEPAIQWQKPGFGPIPSSRYYVQIYRRRS